MSYILEALKKAEQKREQEEIPRLPTFLTGTPGESRRRARWPYVLIAALLLNAGLVVWRLVPGQPPSPPPVAQSLSAPPVAETPSPVAPAAPARVHAKTNKKAGLSPVPSVKETPVVVVPMQPEPPAISATADTPRVQMEKEQPAASAAAPGDLAKTAPALPVRVEKARPVAAGKIFALKELPSTIRSALPEFKISGHAYTGEAQTRVVRLNDKILQEGQDCPPG